MTFVNFFAVVFLVLGVFFGIWQWDWIVTETPCRESGSTTLRNLGFVAGGLLAIGFGIWRGVVADRQAKASQKQAMASLNQVEISQRGLLNERYQKGAEMLGSEKLTVRLGGIYALARLAREHPGDYHTQIMRLLCAFVRHPVGKPIEVAVPIKGLTPEAEYTVGWEEEDADRPLRVREDVQAVMTVLGGRSEVQIKTEERENCRLDLVKAYLRFVRLVDADLNRANLPYADLTCAVLGGAKLKGAYLRGANFEDAQLLGAKLTGITMTECEGLTQQQLDEAVADRDNPPKLDGAYDAKTGKLLEWRDKPCRK